MLRTPVASEVDGGATAPEVAKAKGQTLRLSGQMIDMVAPNQLPRLLATPVASEGLKAPAQQNSETKSKTGQVWLSNQAKDIEQANTNSKEIKLPTPNTMDHLPARTPQQKAANKGKGGYANVRETVVNDITNTNWGKFEPAIRRWENTINRPAPTPTTPDGKDGAHRLSSKFTEWMMGLPEGWITGVGLSRNDELKACGNGVVPQQAELALRMLLDGITVPSTGGGK